MSAADIIKQAFRDADLNKDGFLDKEEIAKLLQHCKGLSDRQVDQLFATFYAYSDGKLIHEAFADWLFTGQQSSKADAVVSPEDEAPEKVNKGARIGSRTLDLSTLEEPALQALSQLKQCEQGADADRIQALRNFLSHASEAAKRAEAMLEDLLKPETKVSRSGYLKSLPELIPRPPEQEIAAWKDHYEALAVEAFISLFPSSDCQTALRTLKRSAFLPLEVYLKKEGTLTSESNLTKSGWDFEDAKTAAALGGYTASVFSAALVQGNSRYAGALYAVAEAIARTSQKQHDNQMTSPKLFFALKDAVDVEPAWQSLLESDATGFCGVLSKAPLRVESGPAYFTAAGFAPIVIRSHTPRDCAVVCFEPGPKDDAGLHAPAFVDKGNDVFEGYFPPNTLFKVKSVSEKEFEAPNGVMVQQRLITVTATYHPYTTTSTASADGKLCSKPLTLTYSNRLGFIGGLNDITGKPLFTMEQEFSRDYVWKDFNGTQYSLKAEWQYVTGPASKLEGCTPGTRDANNDGKTTEQFLKEVNEIIRQHRAKGPDGGLPEKFAFLILEEVLAIRLYSGPSFQPLNGFLRQISTLSGDFRKAIARSRHLTFAATVGHIIRGIRKLAAVVPPKDADVPLYRGVRGKLPEEFWIKDELGLVCATDVAFMSTSKNMNTPVHYMGEGENVLWQLESSAPSDVGYHRGADISMLSQFAGEDEVLFPPYTMLHILETSEAAAEPRAGLQVTRHSADDGRKTYLAIKVKPQFE